MTMTYACTIDFERNGRQFSSKETFYRLADAQRAFNDGIKDQWARRGNLWSFDNGGKRQLQTWQKA
jgi:hypothetical protein